MVLFPHCHFRWICGILYLKLEIEAKWIWNLTCLIPHSDTVFQQKRVGHYVSLLDKPSHLLKSMKLPEWYYTPFEKKRWQEVLPGSLIDPFEKWTKTQKHWSFS